MKVLVLAALVVLATAEGNRHLRRRPYRRSLTGQQSQSVQYLSHAQPVQSSVAHSAFAHQHHAQLVAAHQQERLSKLASLSPAASAGPVATAHQYFITQHHQPAYKQVAAVTQPLKYALPAAQPVKYGLPAAQPPLGVGGQSQTLQLGSQYGSGSAGGIRSLIQHAHDLDSSPHITPDTVRLIGENQPSTYRVSASPAPQYGLSGGGASGRDSVTFTRTVSPIIEKPSSSASYGSYSVPAFPTTLAPAPNGVIYGTRYPTYAAGGSSIALAPAQAAAPSPPQATGSQEIISYISGLAGSGSSSHQGGPIPQKQSEQLSYPYSTPSQSYQIEQKPTANGQAQRTASLTTVSQSSPTQGQNIYGNQSPQFQSPFLSQGTAQQHLPRVQLQDIRVQTNGITQSQAVFSGPFSHIQTEVGEPVGNALQELTSDIRSGYGLQL